LLSNILKGQNVNHHSDIRSQVLRWIEQKLDVQERSAIDRHLEECAPCRRYFETISAAVLTKQESSGSALVADPYLPARIKALQAASGPAGRRGALTALVWGWRTVALAVAVLLGIYMGEELSRRSIPSKDHTIVTAYSTYLGDVGLAGRIQSLAVVAGEELP
jgi:predicted anti-sigma-YlaC factor YlaD